MKKRRFSLLLDGWAVLLGGSIPLAFSPFGYDWLAPVALSFFLLTIRRSSLGSALWRGFLLGLALFGVGVSWVFISIHEYGNTNLFLASLITLIFIVTLSLFPLCFSGIAQYISSKNRWAIAVILPLVWIFLEWLRATVFTGFPWLLLGYSQTHSPLRGFAPLIGAYGVSGLVVFCACLIAFLWQDMIHLFHQRFFSFLYSLAILAFLWVSGNLLTQIHWTSPIGDPIRVALIQGNIPQQIKWSPKQIQPTLKQYRQLTERAWNNDLIVWPEAAIPLTVSQSLDYLLALDQSAKRHHAAVLLGIPFEAYPNLFYNGALMLGQSQGHYFKRHLVPFGEYVPFERYLRGLIGFFDIPMSDFSPGQVHQSLLKFGKYQLATYICYEMAYTHLVLHDLPQANLLITLTNDAWFGQSMAAAQHLQIGQFRSLETGRYMLFVANTGITAIINAEGRVIKKLPRLKTGILFGNVYAMQGSTPYIRLAKIVGF